MKRSFILLFALSNLVLGQVPEQINYQGRLIHGGQLANGSTQVVFRIFDAGTGGNAVYAETQTVTVVDGLYATSIGRSNATPGRLAAALATPPVWLELDIGGTTMLPREPILSVAYALSAGGSWLQTGNSGTTPGLDFLGTTDNQPLELRVNNQRVGLFESGLAPNILFGAAVNDIQGSTFGARIGGGLRNLIGDVANYAVIGGGLENSILNNCLLTRIGGGWKNSISNNSDYAIIAGGATNIIGFNSDYTTISGGFFNEVVDFTQFAVIGGGCEHIIGTGAGWSTIPGGRGNGIGDNAQYAFAAGRRAKADHSGAFVWADSANADFASTANNQFLIRSAGGVGINTTDPQGDLHLTDDGAIQVLLEADANNIGEDQNVTIQFSQDGGLVTGAIGINGVADQVFMGALNNATVFGSFNNYPVQLFVASNRAMTIQTDADITAHNDFHVSGTLSKSLGSFKIDHPLDPANKFLSHSFVESPDMMNVYNGNVRLDDDGEAE
ncbi:MAG: hypothetical protein AAF492_00420, partial [Verrucomicrobiota bacterium]